MSASDRDERGRFQKGNPGGPGRPSARRTAELQAAIGEVATPQRVKVLLATMMKAAIERQDVAAARLVLDRVLGKPRSEPLQDVDLGLPDGLKSADDVAKAANAILQGMAAGAIPPEDAHRLAVVVDLARRSLETQELERRISELEERARREKHR